MKICRACAVLSFLITIFHCCSLPTDDDEEVNAKDDITSSLPWNGETEKFTINAKEGVHLNDPDESAGTAYVTTPFSSIQDTRWEFGVRLTFNPSANNYARFYLSATSDNLSESLNGYFIQIGGAKDNVALYRQDDGQPKLLASGRELMAGNDSPKLYIKVECDKNGYWTFWTRLESESEYTKEKQVKDNSIQSSVCCGIYCVYTKTRRKGITFHHIQLSNGVETNTQPGGNPGDSGEDTPDTPDIPTLPEDVRGMLLFNEVMYDNATNGAEYVEIYNPTDEAIILSGLYLYLINFEDGMVKKTITLQKEDSPTPFTIASHSYLCFTKSASIVMQKHKVGRENLIEISNFPRLNNDGDCLGLSYTEKPTKGHTFDTCRFINWMHGTDKRMQGISLEKKSPELSSVNANWRSSNDTTGGTPGRKNSSE